MSEILAPAGNPLKLRVAALYGADAVYLAGQRFGLRYAADNFTDDQLRDACIFAKQHGVRVYVTMNAFSFDDELADMPAYVRYLEEIGVQAVIVSDPGVAHIINDSSNLRIHVSTQASTINSWSARFWQRLGAKRVVLGREASIADAIRIKKGAELEVEMFVHGSMCMAFSGNCTISNYTAGRDSNRGGCSHACRLDYRLLDSHANVVSTAPFMSSKDLMGLQLIPEMVATGIDSFKIEGRMKSPWYVASTVLAYRSARDEQKFKRHLLEDLPNRGLTQANLKGPAGSDSVSLEGHQRSGFDMAGYVMEMPDDSHIAVWLNNPVGRDQSLELLNQDGELEPLDTSDLRDAAGNRLDKGKPNSVVIVPRSAGAEPFRVIRLAHAS